MINYANYLTFDKNWERFNFVGVVRLIHLILTFQILINKPHAF